MSERKPAVEIRQVLQICVVVTSLERAMRRYEALLGLGPWQVSELGPPTLRTSLRGVKQPYSMKIALAQAGGVQWELIQPLEGPSIYKEFLAQRGEGLHHIAVATDNHDESVRAFEKHGIGVAMDGRREDGTGYTYMDTQDALGFVLELYRR